MKNGFLATVPLTGETERKSGLVIPDNEDMTQTTHAEVVAVAKGSEYKEGQVVLFSKLVPDDFQLEHEGKFTTLWFVKESDIKAILG